MFASTGIKYVDTAREKYIIQHMLITIGMDACTPMNSYPEGVCPHFLEAARRRQSMLIDQFTVKAEAVSSEVHRFATRAEVLQFIVSFLKKEGVDDEPGRYAVWADGPFLQAMHKQDLSQQIRGLRFDVNREVAAAAKCGISEMDWAVADTGTLVHDATAAEERLVSSLPEIHIAIIASDRVLPDLSSLFATIHVAETPYLAFITGPSRTADIERVLTIGVHGPSRLVILFVDENGGRK